MLIRTAMVPNPLIVRADTSVVEFVDEVLGTDQTTATVVSPDSEVLGIISVTDVFRAAVPRYLGADSHLLGALHDGYFNEKFDELKAVPVSAIMATEVDTVSPDDEVTKAFSLFVYENRKTLPVVENGKFIGTVTRRSVLWSIRHGQA
jgi:CBS domain-containing protein